MHLMKAFNQWANRPADERFGSLEEMLIACADMRSRSLEGEIGWEDINVEPEGEEVILQLGNSRARMTNWAFGQLCSRVKAPAKYLQELSPELAAENLRYGLEHTRRNGVASMMAVANSQEDVIVNAITSDRYTRIWNDEIIKRLIDIQEDGWRVPPARPSTASVENARPATALDVLNQEEFGLNIKEGDLIAPAGLYASDRDMFCFLVNDENRIDDGTDHGLGRGFFMENSLVGASSFRMTMFLYRYVCGNHIVWDASQVQEISIKHIGNADGKAWRSLAVEVKKYADDSANEIEGKIERAKEHIIAASPDKVIDWIFANRLMSRKKAEQVTEFAHEDAEQHGYDARSIWATVQGISRQSQEEQYATSRVAADRVSSKLLAMVN
jgi:hypothetical protein